MSNPSKRFRSSHVEPLKAVFSAELGIASATSLTQRILDFYGLPSIETVLHRLTTSTEQKIPEQAAKLVRILLQEAENGDQVAQEIVRTHGASLADHAIVAARRFGFDALPSFYVVLAGSVVRNKPPVFTTAISERILQQLPQAGIVFSRFEPVVGAVLLALESIDILVTDALIQRLGSSLPSQTLFVT